MVWKGNVKGEGRGGTWRKGVGEWRNKEGRGGEGFRKDRGRKG